MLLAAAGLAALAAAASLLAGWVDWHGVGKWLLAHAAMIVLGVAAAVLLAAAVREWLRHRGTLPRAQERERAPLSWWAVAAGAVLVAAVATGATRWLLAEADKAPPAGQPAARVEAIKTGVGIGAGTGGILALMLAVRRQWHQEHATQTSDHDATQRRVTELYTKAVEQLGSDKAPVRLGGLYALERLAQDNPTQRQTIVNVLCAYLRMPYTPPTTTPSRRLGVRRPLTKRTAAPTPTQDDAATIQRKDSAREEREVRLAAQRILAQHLRPGTDEPDNYNETYWGALDIDLTGTTLTDLDFSRCRIRTLDLHAATFTGDARFRGVTLTGNAGFNETLFTGNAAFGGATFTGEAAFGGATFTGSARFNGTLFAGDAAFDGAAFTGEAAFNAVLFAGDTWFDGATFSSDAGFNAVIFNSSARFNGATFTGDAEFNGASFAGDAGFDGTTFTGGAEFNRATFKQGAPKGLYLDEQSSPSE
ncbi:hypothetical protein Aglo03_62610 [Actinokineospora globicatena]|uniref:Pentapeptide repeat-containing protein n=1 Tax=Actinokineospora globicatena TaxID=103729 RepID=A0A9W6QSM0_9PSEU|nr:hypothetical protein Aglo03_62610 [Actinokineospora globicatena]